jgi:hypothetical protein
LEVLGTNAQLPESEVPTWTGVFAMPHPVRRVKARTVATAAKTALWFRMGGDLRYLSRGIQKINNKGHPFQTTKEALP